MIQNDDRALFILVAVARVSSRKIEIYIYFRMFVSLQLLDVLIK